MTIESDADLAGLQAVGRVTALILQEMLRRVAPGMSTLELDAIGRQLFARYGAQSAPRLTYDFPGYTCISVNEEAAHGVPGARVLQPGDMVNVDVSTELNGYFADTGATTILPPATALQEKLCYAGKLALQRATAVARHGAPLNAIGKAIQGVAREKGFKVIRNLCSHGVGRGLHEEPKEIPGYYEPRDTRRLRKGMVITIEPFLATRSRLVREAADGWTLLAEPGNLSAQYEHTMVITDGAPLLLTVA